MFSHSRLILFLLLTLYPGSLLHAQDSTQQLAFVRGEDIILFDAASGTETLLLEDIDPAPVGNAWSPDGSKLAFIVDDGNRELLYVLDTSSGEVYQPAIVSDEMRRVSIHYFDWSPDDQSIAYNLYYHDPKREQEVFEFYVIATSEGSQPRLIGNSFMDFQWMPDSRHILYGVYGGTGEYYRYDITTGVKEPLSLPRTEYHQTWSPDVSQVLEIDKGLHIGETDVLWLYDVETGEKSHVAEVHRLLSANFSPDGQWIAYVSDTRYWGEQMTLIHKPTGQEKWLDVPGISYQKWAPDSSMIAYTLNYGSTYSPGGALYIFDIETEENRLIADEASPFIGWSPDSHWFVYQTEDDLNLIDDSHDSIVHNITNISFVIGWRP